MSKEWVILEQPSGIPIMNGPIEEEKHKGIWEGLITGMEGKQDSITSSVQSEDYSTKKGIFDSVN